MYTWPAGSYPPAPHITISHSQHKSHFSPPPQYHHHSGTRNGGSSIHRGWILMCFFFLLLCTRGRRMNLWRELVNEPWRNNTRKKWGGGGCWRNKLKKSSSETSARSLILFEYTYIVLNQYYKSSMSLVFPDTACKTVNDGNLCYKYNSLK